MSTTFFVVFLATPTIFRTTFPMLMALELPPWCGTPKKKTAWVDKKTVWEIRCIFFFFLVVARAPAIILGAPEGLGRFRLRHNLARLVAALGGELLDFCKSLLLLLWRVKEDGRAILRAPVRSLAVERRGIVQLEERVEQFFVAHFFRVEIDLDDFRVAGLIGAHVLISRAVMRSALVAHGRRRHAGDGRKRSLHAPKTSCSKCRFFCAHMLYDVPLKSKVTAFRRRLL